MSSLKKLTFGNVILCGYATVSEGRKYTLVNVFAGRDVLLSNFPGTSMFGFYAELIPGEEPPKDLLVEVLVAGKPSVKMGFAMEPMTADVVAVLLMPSFPIKVDQPSEVEFRISAEGYEPVTVMRKNFGRDPTSPTASPPPS